MQSDARGRGRNRGLEVREGKGKKGKSSKIGGEMINETMKWR